MKFGIIGCGNTGHAVCAYLSHRGGECAVYTRSSEKARIINENGITSEGSVCGNFHVKATTIISEAVDGSDIILVMTTANAHRDVAIMLKPLLTTHQKVLIFNSNWGALEFKQVLDSDIDDKDLIIAETGSQLFLASSKTLGHVHVGLKEKIYVSATDPTKTPALLKDLKEFFPQLIEAKSIVETSLSTTNPVIHAPISLLNAARIENGQPFLFYGEGVSMSAIDLILQVDKERIEVAKALGYDIDDVLTGINSFWEKKHDNLYDALTKNDTYNKSPGPSTLNHRYFTEDIPYGIVPISKIGRLLGIETPNTDSLLSIFRNMCDSKLIDGSIEFNKEDLIIA